MAYASLDATVAGASANSYATEAEADDYVDGIPATYTTTWDAATTEQKEDALMWATRLLDNWVDWKGTKSSTTQRLRWPRSYVYTPDDELLVTTAIPTFLIEATSELARQLLAKDLTREPTRGIDMIKTGEVTIDFDTDGRQRQVLLKSVQMYIHPYHNGILESSGRKQAVRV